MTLQRSLKCLVFLATIALAAFSFANPATDALRATNISKLAGMSDTDRAALDKTLEQALHRYYREDYAGALPLFEQVAAQVETMDVKFWLGTSAARTGNYRLAKAKFEDMLALDATLFRVRLEYADLLERMGNPEQARNELRAVRDAKPPAGVIANIDRRLARLTTPYARTRWSLDVSTGYQYDDNVTAGPDVDNIVAATGSLRLGANQTERADSLWLFKTRANLTHDVRNRGGLAWGGWFDLFSSQDAEYGDVSYISADLRTGPIWSADNYVLVAPFGFRTSSYGHEKLSDTSEIGLDWTLKTSETSVWRMRYDYARERYSDPIYAGNDNQLNYFAVGPRYYFDDGRQYFSALASYEQRDADTRVFSHKSLGLEFAWGMQVNDSLSVAAQYRRLERDYRAPAPLFSADREDSRDMLVLGVNVSIRERFYVATSYLFLRNASNTGLYDYTKNAISFEVGMRL